MRTVLSFLLIFISFSGQLFAKTRTLSESMQLAADFFSSNILSTRSSQTPIYMAASSDILMSYRLESTSDIESFYIFNNGTEGFVIISGDDRMNTILGYSLDSPFQIDDLQDNIIEWLLAYDQEMRLLSTQQLKSGFA